MLQCPIRRRSDASPTLHLPPRDPRLDLRAALSALNIDRRDDTRPVDGERKARELVERAVFRVGHAEEPSAGR